MRKLSKKRNKHIFLTLMLLTAVVIFSALSFVSITYIATPLNVDALNSTNLGVEIYGKGNNDNQISYSSEKKIVSCSNLPPYTVNAFIAIEDKRFYDHNGYDLKRIAKAGLVNLKSKSKSQGASTITQQLVKNTLLTSEKTYSRKYKEIILSIKTEKKFSKQDILDMYLNSIYFGSNAYGIENASNLYFNKPASELDINESAILASIIKSPVYYSPISHNDNCFNRKNLVLKQMYEDGYITLEEYEENISKPVQISYTKNNYDNSYNQQVILEACSLLNISEKELIRQGFKIYTYLDTDIQNLLIDALSNYNIEADKLSMVADKNGKVLAYAGDSYYDLSVMKRNPASTIKPLLVYLPAMQNKSPASPILDEKLDNEYSPKNAGNNYMGWISLREAISHSSNVCAVKLLDEIGINIAKDYAEKFDFNINNNDLSIALGNIGGGIKPINLAHAYSILQNNGTDKGFTFISKIENIRGKTIYLDDNYSNELFNSADCELVNDMLISCAKTGTAKRLADLPFEVASKTGTAEINGKHSDLWNIAYTTEHLLLTWVGDATSKGLNQNFSSSFYPTMINKDVFKNLYPAPPTNFSKTHITKIALDKIVYEQEHKLVLATNNTPERYKIYEWFNIDNLPTETSTIFEPSKVQFDVELTKNGAKITLTPHYAYTYQVFRTSTTTDLIANYLDQPIIDDKVFKFNKVEYFIIATNKYTKQQYTSPSYTLYPEEFLVNLLNNNFINKHQNKTKWYI